MGHPYEGGAMNIRPNTDPTTTRADDMRGPSPGGTTTRQGGGRVKVTRGRNEGKVVEE